MEKKDDQLKEEFFINPTQKLELIDLILKSIEIEDILELYNPKLKEIYLSKITDDSINENLNSKDKCLSKFKVKFKEFNNEEKMLYAFLCPDNMVVDLKDLLSYVSELYDRLLIVNKSNLNYINGHLTEIYSFVLKQAAEHFYSSKLQVFMTDEDDEEYKCEKKELSEEETRQQMQEVLDHPLFMTTIPDKVEGNVHLEALQAIKYEDNPQNIAEQNLIQSKESFEKYIKFKKFKDLKESMLTICNAIDHCCSDPTVFNSSKVNLYLQRVELNLHLKNYKHAIEDLTKALEFYNNSKDETIKLNLCCDIWILFDKLIDCYIEIKNYQLADKMLQVILSIKKNHLQDAVIKKDEYNEFINNFDIKKLKLDNHKLALSKELEQQEVFKQLEKDEKERMYEYLTSVGIKMKPQYHKIPISYEAQIYLDENDKLHFPLLVIYEEFNITDYIQDFIQDSTIEDLLEMLFSQDMMWDKEKKYSKFSVRMFYEMTILDNNSSSYTTKYYYPLKNQDRLIDLLTNKNVIMNGFPTISVTSINSNFFQHFLKTKIILKRNKSI